MKLKEANEQIQNSINNLIDLYENLKTQQRESMAGPDFADVETRVREVQRCMSKIDEGVLDGGHEVEGGEGWSSVALEKIVFLLE